MRYKPSSASDTHQNSRQKAFLVPSGQTLMPEQGKACHFSNWKWYSTAAEADLYHLPTAFQLTPLIEPTDLDHQTERSWL